MVKTICVCGAGAMGSGIAQVAAQSGFQTILFDINGEVLLKAKAAIQKNLLLLTEKKKILVTEKDETWRRLNFVPDITGCTADVVIEAIVENILAKVELFNQLATVNKGDNVIFGTNTSSLSVSSIAGKVPRPERIIGIHFFNPVPQMKLVEIVQTTFTDQNTIANAIFLARAMGKTPVLCKDAPGFIVNHVARPFYLESLRLIE